MESDKYVTNSGQGRIHLESSLLDSLHSLDILYANECETVPKDSETSIEAYFYRGGQVQWLNFYLAEKGVQEDDSLESSFIKRDGYMSVYKQVERQMGSKLSVCCVYLSHGARQWRDHTGHARAVGLPEEATMCSAEEQ